MEMPHPHIIWPRFVTSLLLHGAVLCCVACLYSRQTPPIPVFQAGEFSLEFGAAAPEAPAPAAAALPPPAPQPAANDIAMEPETPPAVEEVAEEESGEMQIASEQLPAPPPAPPPAPAAAAAPHQEDRARPETAPAPGAPNPGLAGAPRLNASIHPVYPPGARLRGEEGKVVVRASVSASGKAEDAEVVRSSGYPDLDQAALNAVSRARFIPARNGRVPVAAQTTLAFRFTLLD